MKPLSLIKREIGSYLGTQVQALQGNSGTTRSVLHLVLVKETFVALIRISCLFAIVAIVKLTKLPKLPLLRPFEYQTHFYWFHLTPSLEQERVGTSQLICDKQVFNTVYPWTTISLYAPIMKQRNQRDASEMLQGTRMALLAPGLYPRSRADPWWTSSVRNLRLPGPQNIFLTSNLSIVCGKCGNPKVCRQRRPNWRGVSLRS